MSKTIIFQKSFLVSGIMCFNGCGNTIQGLLHACIDDCKKKEILPADARLIVDAEPSGLGIHQFTISIETEKNNFIPIKNFNSILFAKIKEEIIFEIVDDQKEKENKPNDKKNWINIFVNLMCMGAVLALTLTFPPSIILTIGLTALTFFSTAFTAREYLFAFFRNFRAKNFTNMATTISLGWFLSMAHTLFHAISMPLASNFSMIFMNFMMPTMLIACINGMDEVKRLVIEKSKKIQLKGIKTLFPQMSETYRCYELTQPELELLSKKINQLLSSQKQNPSEIDSQLNKEEHLLFIQELLNTKEISEEKRNLLREGMLIEVNAGECFPVDCILIQGNTVIDASLLTGEPHQTKQLWQHIPSGAINLGKKVTVYAEKNSYNSTVNTLLFRSNRAKESATPKEEIPKFAYLYTALVILGFLAAIFTPIGLGIATIPLVMQNIIGILFSVCPCTIAIAHQLPQLISIHHRNNKGIQLRDDSLIAPQSDEIHTVVFDKTGTLTTGNSIVESSDIPINSSLWQRIYLLEKAYGRGHPLAKAIQKYYKVAINNNEPRFDEINECTMDPKNRGLSARVQERIIQIGSVDYLRDRGITLPEPKKTKIEQGFSAVCVAEDGIYKGVIYVKHEVRKGVIEALTRLRREGKKIIMLTGDNLSSAKGFNKHMGPIFINNQMVPIFNEEDIHAGQTPKDKETFLKEKMEEKGANPKGVWFVGDGLNDAPCCRIVSEKGGVSCAMDSNDKSSFFTDITLNGSLDYLFVHNKLNRSLQQNITQNKGILIYSTLAFLAFIISFSIAGVAVSPLIPMAIMLSTTLFVLFNSYRTQLNIDSALDKEIAWPKKLLSSNLSIGLLLTASTLLISSVLVATIATGGLALPLIAFTAGTAIGFSSACTLSALSLIGVFLGILSTSLLSGPCTQDASEHRPSSTSLDLGKLEPIDTAAKEKTIDFFLDRTYKSKEKPRPENEPILDGTNCSNSH
ncbi:TPA: HAD-IC family P-type ATPase [Legionella anisa]|uniref:HAD-IC family P-type ATPase n=1 Tax=Legionella anisa TaxID=28082 RepID=UPI00037A9CF9|nr:HAD-IC family P-type ATPase [Legionella anisa]AWN72596.1 cation-transporting P-type ATPase [Legionella anisa]MBN5935664.1 cation-translocating P-type ATPase [Legionella anisa]MCW8423371.1 HAD-IC family P-type ATPase [Legionella anisa]MCW8446891.1 HAD-IC family P-type ATPase [Legionella anisa]